MKNSIVNRTFKTCDIQQQVQETIIALHQFFESWLGGTLEMSEEHILYLEAQFATGFMIVLPQGSIQLRNEAIEGLIKARGSVPGLKIVIRDVRIVFDDTSSVMAVYKEEQLFEEVHNQRISSVLFQKGERALKWLLVQETFKAREAD